MERSAGVEEVGSGGRTRRFPIAAAHSKRVSCCRENSQGKAAGKLERVAGGWEGRGGHEEGVEGKERTKKSDVINAKAKYS